MTVTAEDLAGGGGGPHGELRPTADLLADVLAVLAGYVVLPSEAAADAVALWTLHTWAFAAAHTAPYLLVKSAEKGSGKSRLLEVLELLTRAPWACLSASESVLFRRIERDVPTLLLDEIDAVFGAASERTEPLRAVLNGGNRAGAVASRVVGQGAKLELVDFPVFCPKALFGIDSGRIPETVADRSVVIAMQRRRRDEPVRRLRQRQARAETESLRADLATWGAAAVEHLQDADPGLPDELSDRAADSWEPLLAIADLAGHGWDERARRAALSLSATGPAESTSRGAMLLGAIAEAMGDRAVIATTELLAAINGDDELPFGGWSDGRGLDARGLARLLRPYGVERTTVRLSADRTAKGYRREGVLADAIARYVSHSGEGSQGSHGSQGAEGSPENPHQKAKVTDVTQVTPIRGGSGVVTHAGAEDGARGPVQATIYDPAPSRQRPTGALLADALQRHADPEAT